jgi:hypothetical protein
MTYYKTCHIVGALAILQTDEYEENQQMDFDS